MPLRETPVTSVDATAALESTSHATIEDAEDEGDGYGQFGTLGRNSELIMEELPRVSGVYLL
jgi:hypothetical protein